MVRQLSLQHRIFVCKSYFKYESARRVRNTFVKQFPGEVPASRAQIQVIVNKFETTGSVPNKKHACTQTVLTEEKLDDIGANLEWSPNKSGTFSDRTHSREPECGYQIQCLYNPGRTTLPASFISLLVWSAFIITLLTGSAAQQVSPCPSVLQYLRDRTIVLTVKPPYIPGSKIHLQIRMFTTSKQRVEKGEELLLLEDKDILNERLLSGSQSPIKYKVSFTSRVPAVVKDIILNNHIICKNKDIDNGKYFEVNLAHFFQPEGKAVAVPPLHLDLGIECGKPDIITSFIHRGDPTDPGQWPWHVGLYWQTGASQTYKCGGTLVTQTAVITAAHCVADARSEAMDPKMLTVYLGKHRLSLWGDEVQAKEIKSVHVHPSYNSSSHYNDIAVLKLRTPAYISIFVKPVCVWGRNDDDLQEIIGKIGFVVGWGENEYGQLEDSLKLGKIEVVPVRDCVSSYTPFALTTTDRTFCAGFRNGTQTPCLGDSGGGIFFKPVDSDEWLLRGVVSFGAPRTVDGKITCDPNHYVVFTDVVSYREWIVPLLK